MKVARFTVKRPVLTIMCAFIALILGAVSLSRLPVDLFPDMTKPMISIRAYYDNAGPKEVEETVTRKIEDAVSAVEGVKKLTSLSREERSDVYVEFEWGTDIDVATNDIRDRLDRTIKSLPDEVERPTIRKFKTDNIPVLFLGIATNMDLLKATKMIEDQVQYRFERLPGVGEFAVWGGKNRQIQVNLDRDKVMALKLNIKNIENKIKQSNLNYSAGTIDDGHFEVNLRTPGEFVNLDELRKTAIATTDDGRVIRLEQIAEVKDTFEKKSRITYINGRPGLMAIVRKRSGYNTVDVANSVLKEIDRVNRDFSQIYITPIVNSAEFIEKSIENVSNTAMQGGLLAILVLLFFLRNIRSTLVIAISIPLSIITTFAVIYFSGYTLNLVTLGGLALGIGMLVDNSIVVLENITRYRDKGQSGHDAAITGTEEVASAITASTLTTLAVFLPLVFMRGMAGLMFREFSAVVAFSLLCSLFVAVTVVPMIAARVVKPSFSGFHNRKSLSARLFLFSGNMLNRLDTAYKNIIDIALNNRFITCLIVIVLLGGAAVLAKFVGTELMPTTDEGRIRVDIELAEGTSLDNTDKYMQIPAAIVKKSVPEMKNSIVYAGDKATHKGTIRIVVSDRSERKRTSEQIAKALRTALSGLPGAKIRVRVEANRITGGGSGDDESIQIKVRGHDIDTAYNICRQIEEVVSSIPGVTDVRLNQDKGGPEDEIVIDRAKADSFNVAVEDIALNLRKIVAGDNAGQYRENGDQSDILVKIKDADKSSPGEILDQTVFSREGKPVILRNLVSIRRGRAPTQVRREDRERTITVMVNIGDRPLGDVVKDVREKLKNSIVMPPSFSAYIAGDYEEQEEAFKELILSLVLAVLLVYMVMAAQFESLVHPLVVMFSMPLSLIGVVLALMLSDTTFNMQSFIGCIMLAGIVVNNAILLVDQTNQNREIHNMDVRTALEEAGRSRLRPILMTTLTTVLGLLPMALGFGEGGETQAPLARTVIGGLTSSTLITLIIVPVVYSIFESAVRVVQKLCPGKAKQEVESVG
jgi:HAE1 family hydrophobic/amphiphilic exporter-1